MSTFTMSLSYGGISVGSVLNASDRCGALDPCVDVQDGDNTSPSRALSCGDDRIDIENNALPSGNG